MLPLRARQADQMNAHLSSAFNCVNVAAIFAPKNVYGCSSSVAFHCVPKLQIAATARTMLTGRLHGVLHGWSARRLYDSFGQAAWKWPLYKVITHALANVRFGPIADILRCNRDVRLSVRAQN